MALTYREAVIEAVRGAIEQGFPPISEGKATLYRDRRTTVDPEECDREGTILNIAPGDQSTDDSQVQYEDAHVLEIVVQGFMAATMDDEASDPDAARIPSDMENAQLSRDLSYLAGLLTEILTDPDAEPYCPEWIEAVRITDTQFDLMDVDQSDRPFGKVQVLLSVEYRTPRGKAFVPD